MREKLAPEVHVFEAVIRETVKFKEAPIEGKPITEYNSSHPGAEDYRQLAKEILAIYG